jgi:Uma2 family endonuclease
MTDVLPAITPHTWQKRADGAAQPATHRLLLAAGDRLTRAEFERRYRAAPHIKKAELIEGVVFMPSPVHYSHGRPHGMVLGWLANYCAATPGVEFADNVTVRLDAENEFQPDALLRPVTTAGGQSKISDDDYVVGAPELVVEIAVSSASYDLHDKPPVYRRTGVREYLVWQIDDQQFDWFVLEEGRYVTLAANAQGMAESRFFPGLRLHIAALMAGDLAKVLMELHAGLATDVHAAFLKNMRGKR